MQILEKVAMALRHSRPLRRANWLWSFLRPAYDLFIGLLGHRGLPRIINGTDPMRVIPFFRSLSEVYEPETWRKVMANIHLGDTVADVGAFIGLYTVAFAHRVGITGQVLAFEPDENNANFLKKHLELNKVSDRVKVLRVVVGKYDGMIPFVSGMLSQSHVGTIASTAISDSLIESITLGQVFKNKRLDILKIDVEGYEEMVLIGAKALLSNRDQCPRVIFIEAHPYAWPSVGTTSNSLISLLVSHGYVVLDMQDQPVNHIDRYCEIQAVKPINGQ